MPENLRPAKRLDRAQTLSYMVKDDNPRKVVKGRLRKPLDEREGTKKNIVLFRKEQESTLKIYNEIKQSFQRHDNLQFNKFMERAEEFSKF